MTVESESGERWPQVNACQQPREAAGHSQGTDSPLEPPEWMQPCRHPDFGPTVGDFEILPSRTVRK